MKTAEYNIDSIPRLLGTTDEDELITSSGVVFASTISSRVPKHIRPLGWWKHKILAEIGWKIRNLDRWNMYYKHIHKMSDNYNINFYGDRI